MSLHTSAVPAPENGPDAGAVWHYGDPLGEQRTADRGAIVVDRSHRAVVQLTGAERKSWLLGRVLLRYREQTSELDMNFARGLSMRERNQLEAALDAALPDYKAASGVTGNFSSVGSDTLNNLMTLWAEDFKRVSINGRTRRRNWWRGYVLVLRSSAPSPRAAMPSGSRRATPG